MSKYRELEERTAAFTKGCRDYIKKLPRTITNIEYSKQLARSSGSQAANYIEANESLSRKDFVYRVRICRKEAKESGLWLGLSEPLECVFGLYLCFVQSVLCALIYEYDQSTGETTHREAQIPH